METAVKWPRGSNWRARMLVCGALVAACGDDRAPREAESDGGVLADAGPDADDASVGEEAAFEVVRLEGVPDEAFAELEDKVLPEVHAALAFWAAAGLPVADARLLLGPDDVERAQTAADLAAILDADFTGRVRALEVLAASDAEAAYAALRNEVAPEYYLLTTAELGPDQLPPTLDAFLERLADDERTYTDLPGLLQDLVNGELDFRPYPGRATALPRSGPELNPALPRGYVNLGGPSFHDEARTQPAMLARYLDPDVVIHELGHLAHFQKPEGEALAAIGVLRDYRVSAVTSIAEISADLFVHLYDLDVTHGRQFTEKGESVPVRSYAEARGPVVFEALAEWDGHEQAITLGHALLRYARAHRNEQAALARGFAEGVGRGSEHAAAWLAALPRDIPASRFYSYALEQQALGASLLVRYASLLLEAMTEAVPALASELDAKQVLGVTPEEIDWLEQRVLELPAFRVGTSLAGDQGSELELREEGIFVAGRGPFTQAFAFDDGASRIDEVTMTWELIDEEGVAEELRVGLDGSWVLWRDGVELERFDASSSGT
jgi:hypothetical protein